MTLSSFDYVRNFIKSVSNKPGVYRMLDSENNVLYVGKAKSLKNRLSNYSSPMRLNNRIIKMIESTAYIETIVTKNEVEALLLEASLIKSLQPKYNILLKDDKSFPYIEIRMDHDFPQISKFRGKRKKGNLYFGPFASSKDVSSTIYEIQKLFQLRTCSDGYFSNRKRPCLEYQIKKCSAPCTAYITKEDYSENVEAVKDFLGGNISTLKERLIKSMEEASNNMEYERAAWLRDRIKAINIIQAKTAVSLNDEKNVDVIAIYRTMGYVSIQVFFFRGGQSYGNKVYFPRNTEECTNSEILSSFISQFYKDNLAPSNIWLNEPCDDIEYISSMLSQLSEYKVKVHVPKKGDGKKIVDLALENAKNTLLTKISKEDKNNAILQEIRKVFLLPREIERIEVYDNSHISGSHAVGAMIVCGKSGFIKEEYKKFNIKIQDNIADDYQMLKEVLIRRIRRLISEYPKYERGIWPDLILIDGGKGHMKIVREVIEAYNVPIPYLCIAKGRDRNAGKEHFFGKDIDNITFPKDNDMMKYLQVIRDEAHRYAITSHRKRRKMAISASKIDEIPSIGKIRKKMLLNHFGSYDAIYNASIEEIAEVKGISILIAKKIYDYLHE